MITSKQKIEYYDAIIDVTSVEMSGVFGDKEFDLLAELLKKLTLDTLTIELWPQIISRTIDKLAAKNRIDLSYSIDTKSLTKRIKSLTISQSMWLIGEIENRPKAA